MIGKTGLIYDARMTEHKSKRKHPQRPQRTKFVMKMMEEKYYTTHPKVEYISTINRVVTDDNIRMVHPEKYIKHVSTLWPKTSHRTDITILDTYFNQKTEKCAKLAVGGVLDGIDKVVSGQWENGFACVRPPGHHSGGRHTINGFCIYNNIAIGARYLQQHHKLGRVAIFDWDVHHGDGTQHVFQKDKDVLLINIHRYDRGTFYPCSEFGDVTNQGQGEGIGSKINLPLNQVDQGFKQYKFQAPGDNQYIYLYNRIIEPVLKKFNPDFILISCGFDGARGDPLGGFTITPNGYYYMTKRLMELHKPMLLVLEGGYSLESISLSAEAVMRALVHDQSFPEPMNVSQHQIKYKCQLPAPQHAQIDHMIEVLSKHWPCLKQNEQLKSLTQITKANDKRLFGVVSEQSSSSSSSEEEQDSVSQASEKTQTSESSGHRYNTRSKTRASEKQLEQEADNKQLEKEKKDWEKQLNKMKKRQEKAIEQKAVEQSVNLKQPQSKEAVTQKQKKAQPKQPKENTKKQKKQKKQEKTEKGKTEEEQENDGSVITQFYFAAGHLQKFKNFSLLKDRIQKITYPQEIAFYENMTFEREFTPKYFGKEGSDSIIIQNLLFEQQDPVVIDFKLGKQSNNMELSEKRRLQQQNKEQKSTTDQYGFRISGYTTPVYKEGGILEKGDDNIKKILRNAVTLDNKEFYCKFLKKLSTQLNNSTRRYHGTSILLIKGPKRSDIRWVDFHYWHDEHDGPDKETIKGVDNLVKFIEELDLSS